MKNFFIGILFFSQIFFLGVFALEKKEYFVVDTNHSLCGIFIPGSYEEPNWLPDDWRLELICEETANPKDCCSQKGYQYVNGIGDQQISLERYASEYLGSRNIIEAQSLSPQEYKLADTITRKEMMKIVANIAKLELSDTCEGSFTDVADDWGCKYIEAALKEGLITANNNFRPDDTLNKAEAIKLIFQSRGIEKRYQTNSWQQDYIGTAVYLGYVDEKPESYIASATRSWIFKAVARTYDDFR